MTRIVLRVAAIVAAGVLFANQALAVCSINSTGLTVSPLTASTGTYMPPTAPSAQAVTFTISGTYLSLLGGQCTVGIAFQRATLPATMTVSGGGTATLPYTINTASSGGTSLLYTGGTPAASSLLTSSFTAPLLGVAVPFSTTVTAYFLMQPGSPQQAGSYSDTTLTLNTFNVTILNIVSSLTSSSFSVTGTVAKACTIGGSYNPGADSVTIPVSSAGVVDTSPIVKNYANAECNSPANVQLISQNGGVRATSSVTGFSNVINYSATGAFSSAVAPIDTSTNPSSTGPEYGPIVPTTGDTPSGTLTATITPQSSSLPLVTGTYSDTLSITITPQ